MNFQQIISSLYEGFLKRYKDHDIDIRLTGDRIQFINEKSEAVIHVMDYGIRITTKRFSYNMEFKQWDVDEVVQTVSERIISYDLRPEQLNKTIIHEVPGDMYIHLADESCGCAPEENTDGDKFKHFSCDPKGKRMSVDLASIRENLIRQIKSVERSKFGQGELL